MTGTTRAYDLNQILDKEIKNLEKKIANDKWVVYPEVELTTDDLKKHFNMSEIDNVNPENTELPVVENLAPISLAEEIKAEVEAEIAAEAIEDDGTDDLNKKTYIKITPTLYIKPVKGEKTDDKGEKIEVYKILNPITGTLETRELAGEEKHEIQVLRLKESHIKFHPIKHGVKIVGTQTIVSSIGRERKVKSKEIQTNVTVNQFGADYRKKRQRKNKMQKASRKANR